MADPTTFAYEGPYAIDAFAHKHGLTSNAAEAILFANGPSRVTCDAAAKAFLAAVARRNLAVGNSSVSGGS